MALPPVPSDRLCRAPRRTLLPAMALAAATGWGAEVESVEVTREGNRFGVVSRIALRAPRPRVFAALVDYERFQALSDAYVESRYLAPAADGTPRVYTRVQGCLLFFCRSLVRSARLEVEPVTRVVATVETGPDTDLVMGREVWTLASTADGTLITYRHELEPGFWMPPVIGSWVVRRALAWGAAAAGDIIEEMALADSYTPLADNPCCGGRPAGERAARHGN